MSFKRVLAFVVPLLFSTTLARADDPPREHRLEWNPQWTRFTWPEYVLTPIVGGISIYRFYHHTGQNEPNWTGPILFDEPVRDALRLHTEQGLEDVGVAGDVFILTPVVTVLGVDSLLLPALDHNFDLFWQMEWMNAEAFAASGLVVGVLFDVAKRARPSFDECHDGASVDPNCFKGQTASFPSGHTATGFTAAGLTCAHHANLPLYGGGVPDAIACAASLTFATAGSLMRIMGDRHYATDAIAGAGIGFLFGFGLPELLHYWKHPVNQVYKSSSTKTAVAIGLGSGTTPVGANAYGFF